MKIFFTVETDFKIENGHSIHVQMLARALGRLGHEVRIFTPRFSDFQAKEDGFTISYVPFLAIPKLRTVSMVLTYFTYLLFRSVADRPDVFYSRQCFCSGATRLVARLLRRPFFYEVNGLWTEEMIALSEPAWKIRMVQNIERLNVRKAQGVIAVTNGLAEELVEKYQADPERLTVVPNGVDNSVFQKAQSSDVLRLFALSASARYIGYIGSLSPWQGLDTLISALPEVVSEQPSVVLLIVGAGPLKNELEKTVDAVKLADHVRFLGPVAHTLIPGIIKLCEFCLVPKSAKGIGKHGYSPLKVFEYLAAGKPVIASDVPDINSIVRASNCGLLFKADDPDDLVLKMKMLLNDREKAELLGRNAGKAAEKFDWSAIAARIVSVIRQAMEKE